MHIILGSQSPSRLTLMAQLGHPFSVMSADINEKAIRSDDYHQLPMLLAHAKADALVPQIDQPSLLITSDQVVVCNGQLREKPNSPDQARDYLRSYGQHPAECITAVVVTNTQTEQRLQALDIATAHYSPIPEQIIEQLISKGDVLVSAGGFKITDPLLQPYLIKLEGSMDSVMGFPVEVVQNLITQSLAAKDSA